MRPPSRITTRSDIVIASTWSWVTAIVVIPVRSWIRRTSSCIASRSCLSSAASGSSSSSRLGSNTSARASATRCCWPPESERTARPAGVGQLDELERLAYAPVALAAGDLARRERVLDVARHRHVREQRVALEDEADVALVRRQRVDDLLAQRHAAAPVLDEARDDVQRRRLARAARAEQGDELAGLGLERDAVEHLGAAEPDREVLDADRDAHAVTVRRGRPSQATRTSSTVTKPITIVLTAAIAGEAFSVEASHSWVGSVACPGGARK